MNYDIAALTARSGGAAAVVEAFFTAKDDTVYAILPWWPAGQVTLKDIHPTADASVTMLGLPRKLSWKMVGTGIVVEGPTLSPNRLPCAHAFVIRISKVN